MAIYSVIKVIHILTAIFMAWPFYALVVVNQRAQLGPPLGDRVNIFMETIIRNRAIPCYVFQATVLISGLMMVVISLPNFSTFLQHPNLVMKFGLLLLISSLLSSRLGHISRFRDLDGSEKAYRFCSQRKEIT